MIPRARRACDGSRDVSREQEQDARAVEESPDPDAMAEAFGPITERLDSDTICRMAREYYLEFGWPGRDTPPTPADLIDCETQE